MQETSAGCPAVHELTANRPAALLSGVAPKSPSAPAPVSRKSAGAVPSAITPVVLPQDALAVPVLVLVLCADASWRERSAARAAACSILVALVCVCVCVSVCIMMYLVCRVFKLCTV